MQSTLCVLATLWLGAARSETEVERWGQFEIDLQSEPATGSNPFVDVELNCTFTAEDDVAEASLRRSALEPLVALNFEKAAADGSIVNEGSSATGPASTASIVSAGVVQDVPPGVSGRALDFGTDVTDYHALLLPGDKSAFSGLVHATEFTITGWVNIRSSDVGIGGNRLFNWEAGGDGIDLVWLEDGSIKLSINEWPDGAKPRSASGTLPVATDNWPKWHFFAVSYSADATNSTVKFYFGDSLNAAKLDGSASNTNYRRGAVGDPKRALAFGNYGPGFHSRDRLFRGALYQPRIFGSALSGDEVVQAQARAGCRPDCSRSQCGGDGCGGSCGTCAGSRTCTAEASGTQKCEMPSTTTVNGFYDGGSSFKCRFSPPSEGWYSYRTASNVPGLDGQRGQFRVASAKTGSHGPVFPTGHGLTFADGTPYFSVGTTSYQWTSMSLEMQRQTLGSLRNGQGDGQIFNKMRMTVFPKWYQYNKQNPVEVGTAYEIKPGSLAANDSNWNCKGQCPSLDGSFDLQRFNVSYWQNYERLLSEMRDMGVIADIIVFHPYDNGHWGFDCMGGRDKETYDTSNDKFYLKYLAARFASFSNVWWSMANEWDLVDCKRKDVQGDAGPSPIWDELFQTLSSHDPYTRMAGIHNCGLLYDHSQPWITHVSLQGREDQTADLRFKYGKPVVWDEVEYEGDIVSGWGALSGQEMTDRFWWGASMGAYVGHSETVLRPDIADANDQPLWWAKGGKLIGESPARIKFFRSLWEANSSRPTFALLTPSTEHFHNSNQDVAHMLSRTGEFYSVHFERPGKWHVPLARGLGDVGDLPWEVRYVDYWKMTIDVRQTLPSDASEATIVCNSIPCNIEVARQSPSAPGLLSSSLV